MTLRKPQDFVLGLFCCVKNNLKKSLKKFFIIKKGVTFDM
jgi:hypothetical protein